MSKENEPEIDVMTVDHSPVRKRARYADDSIHKDTSWSLVNNNDVVLHEVFDHGVGRLDSDELSEEEDTIRTRDISGSIDISCVSMVPYERETRSGGAESTESRNSLEQLDLRDWDRVMIVKSTADVDKRGKLNYFEQLSDEVILYIFRWLPRFVLTDVALVCRRFHNLTQDESLWTRMDFANKRLNAGVLGKVLSRQVIILRLAKAEVLYPPIDEDSKAFFGDFRSRLLFLDLSMATISPETLTVLFGKCSRLKKLSLENVQVDDDVLIALSRNRDIEVMNLAMVTGIQQEGLKYLLTNCRRIRELNIAWTYMDESSNRYICSNLPSTLQRLNFSGCRKLLKDSDVANLVSSCPRLTELDLSDCTTLSCASVKEITLLEDLNFLAMSRCYLVHYKAFLCLKNLKSLSYLDIHGGYIDAAELKVIQDGLGSQVHLNKFKFSSVARPTVGLRRSSIWNMRVRD